MLKRIDIIGSWLILITGVLHAASVFYFVQPLVKPGSEGSERELALWWVSGGEALIFGAWLNLVRIYYGLAAPSIIRYAVLANIIMVLFEIWLVINNPGFITIPRRGLLIIQLIILALSIYMMRQARNSQSSASTNQSPSRQGAAI
ncbi:MAG: hypothetical protein ETSY1_01455 [Candidatus Entotheonella factor]|uniref:Uncharacterized protein n=1 Tax=Entotheonella factor TaxID=1429438 RepID=W4M057_ENTF1|nr:MAG: hypothetical protein ETSY1_01455 [Candidatus Entotheonella factor]